MSITLDPEEHETSALAEIVPTFGGCAVLEIGCGDGRLTGRYADRAASVIAIDPDEAQIATFRSDLSRGHVDVRAIGFERLVAADRSFDVILLSYSL